MNMEQIMCESDAIEAKLKAEFGLTWLRYKIIKAVRDAERSTIGAVVQAVGIANSSMTQTLDILERDGWLVRERSTGDRRAIFLRVLRLEELAQAEAFLQGAVAGSFALTA